ncbi:hypothetical protein L3X38_024521 [Prunus dulcis]|uniref:Uncharacterized protein n=1 Tax=Prunus dulcis TaxID=3755 RepID=A0AAD4Z748_PRUDU|nr:hypothetical protein L3X38_024521 [Prunus dulcis]
MSTHTATDMRWHKERQVEILGNVQFIGETLPKFRQKVSAFSKRARHRGDVRNSKGFVSGFGKIRGGSLSRHGKSSIERSLSLLLIPEM